MPKRIQRKRVKGWRKPPDVVSVSRPGRYGNPFRVGERYEDYGQPGVYFTATLENCLELFEAYAVGRALGEPEWLEPLRGKDLACWCKEGERCHADILIQLANV